MPKLGLVPEDVIKKRIVEPTGAVKLCEMGVNPEKPICAMKCVPIHPLEIATPTARDQKIRFLSDQNDLLQIENPKIINPIAHPIVGVDSPEIIAI
tara:strand:+ start:163 stop:450 length:288 start_codon:yes stop_codon:yes gene_type:complete